MGLTVPSIRALERVGDGMARLSGRLVASRPAAPVGTFAVAPAVAALLICTADARAEQECGSPDAGAEIVCSASNYDPERDGNIFYGPGDADDDFTIRLSEGLSIRYDREAPGDDVRIQPDEPDNPRYSAVWVTPWELGSGHAGAIAFTSYADVTSNGRGISVGHYGASGPLRMEILGGSVTTTGERSWAIHSYREGTGDTDVVVRDVPVRTNGLDARAITIFHEGEGALRLDVRDVTLATKGADSDGVYGVHSGAGDLVIGLRDVDIMTEGRNAYGVVAIHRDAGRLDFSARALTIDTAGELGRGIYGQHTGAGDVRIHTRNSAISTTGAHAAGVFGLRAGEGELAIDLRDVDLSSSGLNAYGIFAFHRGTGRLDVGAQALAIDTKGAFARGVYGAHSGAGEVGIHLQDGTVATTGASADGLYGRHTGQGGLWMRVQGLAVTTTGEEAEGLIARHAGRGNAKLDVRRTDLATEGAQAEGLLAEHEGEGALDVTLRDLEITTAGHYAEGILAAHAGLGRVRVDAQDIAVATTGEGSDAILAGQTNDGDVHVSIRDSTLATGGADAHGVFGVHKGDGALVLDFRETAIAATGARADGVAVEHEGSGPLRITVDGGSVRAAGPDAHAIRVGRLNRTGQVEHAADLDAAGFRDQLVTVNGSVFGGSGEGAGVFLAGGGRIVIGPEGSVAAESGVAIRAAGDAPRLLVDMALDDRRVTEVIGDDVIRNDGGETTILVNGVMLHGGTVGATGVAVPNGAWNVTLAGSDTVAGRVFSREDFREVLAPRAAVYEALPGFLLRLDTLDRPGPRVTRPGSPAWVRLSGARGSYAPDRASVGAEYTFDRFAAEAGLEISLREGADAAISVRRLRGSADVTSTTGGGAIETRGSGLAIGVAFNGSDARYARGQFALANYTSDLSSNAIARLASGAEARVVSLDLEAGRHIALDEGVRLTPRVWITGSAVEVDGFPDSTGASVSVRGVSRLIGGVGMAAGTASPRQWQGAALSLRGSLDLEQTLGDARTHIQVSEGTLESEPPGTRLLLGLGGTYRKDGFSLGVQARAGGLLAGDEEYAAEVGFGWKL